MKKSGSVVALGFLILAPSLAFAGSAQFATQSVFLSQPAAPAGTSELVYASVVNTSDAPFSGSVVFTDDTKHIGNVAVALAVGEARVVSVSWVPSAGTHTIRAELISASSTSGSMATSTAATEAFTIAPPPPPPVSTSTPASDAVASSTAIQNSVTDLLPQSASTTVSSVFSAIDAARMAAVAVINQQIDKVLAATSTAKTVQKIVETKAQNTSSPIVITTPGTASGTAMLAASSSASAWDGAANSAYLATLYTARFVLQSAALSYVCVAILAGVIIYLLFAYLRWRM